MHAGGMTVVQRGGASMRTRQQQGQHTAVIAQLHMMADSQASWWKCDCNKGVCSRCSEDQRGTQSMPERCLPMTGVRSAGGLTGEGKGGLAGRPGAVKAPGVTP